MKPYRPKPGENRTACINTRVYQGFRKTAEEAAKARGISLTEFVEYCINTIIAKEGKK